MNRPVVTPMKSYQHHYSSLARSAELIILLPGIHDKPEDFIEKHFISAARKAGVQADFLTVDSHVGYFEDRSIVQRLHTDIILPAKKAGYQKIWLAGISLGGFGALLYATKHAQEIDGVIMLSPYPGTEESIADIQQQGGLQNWQPGSDPGPEQRLWAWIKKYAASRNGSRNRKPEMYLAYGLQDKYKEGHQVLSAVLGVKYVFPTPGGHNWKTWRKLWQTILDNRVFTY
ncbi:MAG: alpha/beta fold hydrolase [Gammaproteobacteria bacterium]